MADFFKGLAGGMQTGLQFGRAMQERQERERLREAMGLTPQEIAPRPPTQDELGRAQAYTRGIADEDARMFATDDSVQNRTGLFSSNPAERPLDASVAPQMPYVGQSVGGTQYGLGGQTFSRMPTQQEIDSARYAAAANVIAERDPAAAMRMRQEQVRMQREAELAPLQKQQLEGSIAGQAQQRQLTGLQLKTAERTAAELQRGSDFAAFAAERPDATVAELKDAAFKQFKFTAKQWQDTVTTRLGIENAEMDSFKNNIKKKLQGKSLAQIGSIYNSDPDFDDKSDLAIVPGKGGAVTLNFIDKATNTITSSQSFKNEALATEYLNKQATEPETIGTWMMNLRKAESAIEAQGAAADKDRALGDRYRRDGETEKGLSKKVADVEASLGRKLSEPEKLTLFGLSARPSNRPEFTPKDYAATISSFVNAGLSPVDATIRADELYGRAPASSDVDAGLRQQDAAKKKGTAAAPIEVQPGERYITAPGATVRAPLNQFLRESRRGLLGGVEYFYTDPVTGKRYTTEQYNQLQNQ